MRTTMNAATEHQASVERQLEHQLHQEESAHAQTRQRLQRVEDASSLPPSQVEVAVTWMETLLTKLNSLIAKVLPAVPYSGRISPVQGCTWMQWNIDQPSNVAHAQGLDHEAPTPR